MAQQSRLLRDNPSGFPMILKNKSYLSNQPIQFTIGILNSRLSMSKKELLPCISILSALKVMKAIFF